MNNGKLQAKQEKIKSLHCPSPQSFLFNSRDSLLNTRFLSLVYNSPVPNPDQSAKSRSFSSRYNSTCSTPSPQNIKESATCCPQLSSERVTRCPQHKEESEIRSLQHLFIDVSTELLRQGKNVRFQAPGRSMHPAIKEGETITVAPIAPFDIKRGDILLYLVRRKVIAHRVVSIKRGKSNFATQSPSHSSANFAIQPISHSSANFAIQSTSHSPANFSTHASTSSLAHSSAHSSTQASIHSKALNPQLIFILRGDASLTCDEPVEAKQILGKVVSVKKGGRSVDLYSRRAKMLRIARACTSRLKKLILRILKANTGGCDHWLCGGRGRDHLKDDRRQGHLDRPDLRNSGGRKGPPFSASRRRPHPEAQVGKRHTDRQRGVEFDWIRK